VCAGFFGSGLTVGSGCGVIGKARGCMLGLCAVGVYVGRVCGSS